MVWLSFELKITPQPNIFDRKYFKTMLKNVIKCSFF